MNMDLNKEVLRLLEEISPCEPYEHDRELSEHQSDIPNDVSARLQKACAGTSFKTLDDLRNQPPLEPLIEGLLVEKTLSSIYGPSGFGKSFVALDWAMGVATGNNVWERETLPGLVLYVVAEGEGGFPLRTEAWARENGMSEPDAAIVFQYIPLDLSNEMEVESFINATRTFAGEVDVPLRLIVLDTLARCMSGNESSTDDMKLAVNGADTIRRELDTSVLLVHHSRKDDGEVMRGSGALWASLQSVINIQKGNTEGEILAVVKKQKDGPEEAFRLQLVPVDCGVDEKGREQSSLCVRFIEAVDEVISPRKKMDDNQPTPTEEAMLALLVAQQGGFSRKDWHAVGLANGIGVDRRATRNEAISGLLKKGCIRIEGGSFIAAV